MATPQENIFGSDEDLHKIMDINKVFPKPPEVEEEMRRQKEENALRAEQEELARVKALAPVLVPPTMNQLMAAQIGFKKIKEWITGVAKLYSLPLLYFKRCCNCALQYSQ